MQKRHWILGLAAALVCALPVLAAAQPHVGVILWRHDTEMDVNNATDWDGSNDTIDERLRDWDINSSGVGVRVGYGFARIFTIHGDIGAAQATARSVDVFDPTLDMRSRGLDEGVYFGVGANASDRFPGAEHVFWGANFSARSYSSEFKEDFATTWELDQTTMSIGGRVGYLVRGVGLYGGLQFVSDDADFSITDLSRLPGLQNRTISLERRGGTDLMVGAEFRGAPVNGFVEVGFVGSFGASTGVAMSF